jgi:hypothetical protein
VDVRRYVRRQREGKEDRNDSGERPAGSVQAGWTASIRSIIA